MNAIVAGAVFGVGGALAVFFYRHKGYFGKTSDAVLQSLGQSLVINLGYGLMSRSVDNWCVRICDGDNTPAKYVCIFGACRYA